jgi:Uma2 family endonuclease
MLELPMSTYIIDLNPIIQLTPSQFDQICIANPDLKLERTPKGELVIMSPTGGETGNRNIEIAADFVLWNRRTKLGYLFDSSTCFRLPNGGDRSPDLSWVEKSRWEKLSPEEKQKFPPLSPDFVLELLSPTDRLSLLRQKMQEYLASGTRLGWLINPSDREVEIYRPDCSPQILTAPAVLNGDPVLPEFTLNLGWLWS